jgi:CHAD domain-containing protein
MKRTTPSELLIRQRLAAVTRGLPGARNGDVNSVHQTRVATRRLREALPVVASGARGRKLEKTVRRLTRALGPVRELDVAILTLDELEGVDEVPKAAIAKLRQVVTEERRLLHQQMCRHLGKIDLDKLQARAVAAARKTRVRKNSDERVAAERLTAAEQRAARRAASLRAAIENASSIYLPDRLHEVRIAVKKLRYAMEITRELRRSHATARIRLLKQAQDLLGRMHDLEVLIARTRAVQGAASAPNLRVSAHLDRLVRRLENECRQLHGQYMASRNKLIAICDHVQHAAEAMAGTATAA